ncbi:MAG: hypothetical protein CL676_05970 [Bdellovibrionaceae bacterium]|nr:hypothetical protein [Pseudobdellovibrionaceae bacterium]
MFKLQTTAAKTFFSLTCVGVVLSLSFGGNVIAKEEKDKDSAARCSNSEIQKAYDIAIRDNHYGKNLSGKEKQKLWDKKRKECINSSPEGCAEDLKKLKEAEAKFNGTCRASGMGTGVECAKKINQCGEKDAVAAGVEEDSGKLYDTEAMKAELEICPAIGAKGLKEMKQELKDAKEEVDKNQEKVDSAKENAQTAQSSASESGLEKQQALQELAKTCRDTKKEIERGLQDAEKEIYNQVQQVYSQVLSVNEQIADAERTKMEASLKYTEAKTKIELDCHQQALTKVNERRQAILAKVAEGTYNVGSLNSMIGSAGKKSRRADQEFAFQEYKYCLQSGVAKKQLSAAKEAVKMAEAAADQRKSSLVQQRAQLQQQMGMLQNNEVAQLRQRAQEDLAAANQDCAQGQQMAMMQMMQAQMQGAKGAQGSQKELKKAELKLKESEDNYKNIRDAVRLKSQAAGGASSGKDFSEVFANLAEYEGKAASFVGACCIGDKAKGFERDCANTKSFLSGSGNALVDTASPSAVEHITTNAAATAQTDQEIKANGKLPDSTGETKPTAKTPPIPGQKPPQILPKKDVPIPTPRPPGTR